MGASTPVLADTSTSETVFKVWVAAQPDRAAGVAAFEQFLKSQTMDGVLPTYQLLRTATDWQACHADPFAVPPQVQWTHIVRTLQFIREQVQPTIGALAAVSGYRASKLNTCAGGGSSSGHLTYYALDLLPLDPEMTRPQLISQVCKLHTAKGEAYAIGLGFYDGVRFHLDSKGFRRWGPDKHAATSPCNGVG